MTQSDLAGDMISRNMICQIERGNGNPSLAVMRYLSKKLTVDPGYFLTEEDDLQQHLIGAAMPMIRHALASGRLRECIRLCEPFTDDKSDELTHILATCYYRCGVENYEIGYLESAKSDLLLAKQYAEYSIYSASLKTQIEYLLAVSVDTSSMHKFQKLRVPEAARTVYETVLYRNVLALIADGNIEEASLIHKSLTFEATHYRRHIQARILIASREHDRAAVLLGEIIRDKEKNNINVPFLMQIYRDLELCLKSTGDFEGAYRCSKQLLAFSENTHL